MSSIHTTTHPILACAQTISDALDDVAGIEALYLSVPDKQTALQAIARDEARLAELKLRLLASAGDVAEETGARDAGTWLAATTRQDHGATGADLRLAVKVDGRYGRVAAGMRAGVVNQAQARVIVSGLEALPADLGPELISRAEAHLVELAQHHGPKELRVLARRILDVLAPEIAEAELAKALERDEQRAQEKTSLRFKAQGDGTTRITGLIPDLDATRLLTYLNAYCSPRRDHLTNDQTGQPGECANPGLDRMPRHRRLGQAFCAMLEHLDPDRLPDHGGNATTVTVTIDHADLTKQLAVAGVLESPDGHGLISASEARRLACNAGILPAVLGGKSEILDFGRTRRLHNGPQRKALWLIHRHCRAEGCTIPARWCEAHHETPWSQGGTTNIEDATLYCSWHHHRAHDNRFAVEKLPNGDRRFHRRP